MKRVQWALLQMQVVLGATSVQLDTTAPLRMMAQDVLRAQWVSTRVPLAMEKRLRFVSYQALATAHQLLALAAVLIQVRPLRLNVRMEHTIMITLVRLHSARLLIMVSLAQLMVYILSVVGHLNKCHVRLEPLTRMALVIVHLALEVQTH